MVETKAWQLSDHIGGVSLNQLAIRAGVVKRLDQDCVSIIIQALSRSQLKTMLGPIGIINFFKVSLKRLGFGFTLVNPIRKTGRSHR